MGREGAGPPAAAAPAAAINVNRQSQSSASGLSGSREFMDTVSSNGLSTIEPGETTGSPADSRRTTAGR